MEWIVEEGQANRYYDFCELASKDDVAFNTFKTNPVYTPILSHVRDFMGHEYAETISTVYPHLLADDRYLINDKIGGAPTMKTESGLVIDPTTLRYLRQVGDITSLCSPNSVVEIGGGYGGLSLMLRQYVDIKSYYIHDIQGPVNLASTYLGKHGYKLDESPSDRYDLVVSTFAWCELAEDARQRYIDDVFAKADHGYIVAKREYSSMHYEYIRNVLGKNLKTRPYSQSIHHYDIMVWRP